MPAQEGIPRSPQESHPPGSTSYPSSGTLGPKGQSREPTSDSDAGGRASNVRHDVTLQKPANPGSDSDDDLSLASHAGYKVRESKNAAARRKSRFASGPVLRAI